MRLYHRLHSGTHCQLQHEVIKAGVRRLGYEAIPQTPQ